MKDSYIPTVIDSILSNPSSTIVKILKACRLGPYDRRDLALAANNQLYQVLGFCL